MHAQFETIHPFLDGNGRIGRLLIAALMEHWRLLPEPLLYLSGYLKQHQAEYYRHLSAIRTDGDWEGWVSFFLEGVAVAATEAERGIVAIASQVAADRRRLLASPKAGPASYRLFEMLPTMPRFTIERVRQRLDTSFPTATAAVKVLEELGIVDRVDRAEEEPQLQLSGVRRIVIALMRAAAADNISTTHLAFRSFYGYSRSQWSYDHVDGAVVRELSPTGVEPVVAASRLKLLRS